MTQTANFYNKILFKLDLFIKKKKKHFSTYNKMHFLSINLNLFYESIKV